MEGKYHHQHLGQKEYNEVGKMVSLMLRLCEPIFVLGKAVVLGSVFCVEKCITELEYKDVYAEDLIKKWRCWPN